MKIFVIYHPEDSFAAEIVRAAMIRSFTVSQVESCNYNNIIKLPESVVMINPGEKEKGLLGKLASEGRKILIFGHLNGSVGREIGLISSPLPDGAATWGEVTLNPDEEFNKTPAAVIYNRNHVLGKSSALNPRHFCRFDFTDEWNNLGYGRISVNGNIWSICCVAETEDAEPVAEIRDLNGRLLGIYASVTDIPSASILWFNRTVGPVDSLEWQVVEKFLGEYRSDDLVCFPFISEIPSGFNGAATMRLDCDQAVSSARQMFELYADSGIPLSLALLTGLNMNSPDKELLSDVLQNGGAILSHSHSHMPDWGGNYETARAEAVRSRRWVEENLPSAAPLIYAVSPFHQNPEFAVKALADAGYRGFIGGIIHNDPEFLFGRAGRVPFIHGLVSHSQQCMLHGDCFHRYGSSADIYKQSFLNHLKAGTIFGYLDHPFSSEYQYGWNSEDERKRVHIELIEFIQSHENIWWANENECLNFLMQRDSAHLNVIKDRIIIDYSRNDKLPPLSVRWKEGLFEY